MTISPSGGIIEKLVHSADDDTVPIACGLDRYQAVWEGDPRFRFLRLEDRGHERVFGTEIQTACLELFAEACGEAEAGQ